MSRLLRRGSQQRFLGQALPWLGSCLRRQKEDRISMLFVILGDGEQDEGQIWEAAMTAAHYKLDNVTAMASTNKAQQTGWVRMCSTTRRGREMRAFRGTQAIDGTIQRKFFNALQQAKATQGAVVHHCPHRKGQG